MTSHQSFQSGAELWITPHPTQSSWTAKIDWLINFQILKAKQLKPQMMSPELKQIQQLCQIHAPEQQPTPERFLFPVGDHLPTQWLAVMPYTETEQNFLAETLSILKSFQAKTVRIFLPKSIKLDLAKKFFEQKKSSVEIQWIPEPAND
jgi:hypothetical protein